MVFERLCIRIQGFRGSKVQVNRRDLMQAPRCGIMGKGCPFL